MAGTFIYPNEREHQTFIRAKTLFFLTGRQQPLFSKSDTVYSCPAENPTAHMYSYDFIAYDNYYYCHYCCD